METSSTPGTEPQNVLRFSALRSCPAFTPSRSSWALSRSLWAMFDLADSLIGKANQIEESCHISFFSEFKKKPALLSDQNRQSGWL
jgi:hypothetical protein